MEDRFGNTITNSTMLIWTISSEGANRELTWGNIITFWWSWRDSDPLPFDCQSNALPIELQPHLLNITKGEKKLKLEAQTQPLQYRPQAKVSKISQNHVFDCSPRPGHEEKLTWTKAKHTHEYGEGIVKWI